MKSVQGAAVTRGSGQAEQTSDAGFRWLAVVTLAVTFGLVVLGGVVRATDSGDACPDWPRCHGELIPPLDANVLIEFSHRLVASIVGFLVLALVLAAWRWKRDVPIVVWGAVLAGVLVVGQIILGGMTVLNDLPANMVTAHLALASALLVTLTVVTLAAFPRATAGERTRREKTARFRNMALLVALAAFALMLSGSYVSGSGASLAFRDWPLFNGSLLPDGGRLAIIHATHRLAAVVIGLLVLHIAASAWRTQRGYPLIVIASTLAVVLYAAQVMAGAANVWTLLQPAAIVAHLATAEALLVTLATVAALAQRATSPVTGSIWTAREPAPAAIAGAFPVEGVPR